MNFFPNTNKLFLLLLAGLIFWACEEQKSTSIIDKPQTFQSLKDQIEKEQKNRLYKSDSLALQAYVLGDSAFNSKQHHTFSKTLKSHYAKYWLTVLQPQFFEQDSSFYFTKYGWIKKNLPHLTAYRIYPNIRQQIDFWKISQMQEIKTVFRQRLIRPKIHLYNAKRESSEWGFVCQVIDDFEKEYTDLGLRQYLTQLKEPAKGWTPPLWHRLKEEVKACKHRLYKPQAM